VGWSLKFGIRLHRMFSVQRPSERVSGGVGGGVTLTHSHTHSHTYYTLTL
jgi:hypothetical protein